MDLSRRIVAALTLGYVLGFWTEFVHESPPVLYNPLDPVITWLTCSVLAYMGLCAAAVFRVRDAAGGLLVAALVGWLAEGVLGQAMYRDFPLGLAREALGWHGLLGVGAGVVGVTLALSARRRWVLTATSVGLGLFWGVWAVGSWVERLPVSVAAFAAHAALSTGLLIAAHRVLGRLGVRAFQPTPSECRALGFIGGAYFLLVAVPAAPVAIAVAPAAFGLTLWALCRDRGGAAAAPPALAIFDRRPVQPERYASLALMPLTAVVVYAVAEAGAWRLPIREPVTLALAAAGAAAYVASVAWVIRRGRSAAAKAGEPAENAADSALPA